jgi:hypothetical protein
MPTTTDRPATPRQTFALFCATGHDWRKTPVDFDTASMMLSKVMGMKNKPSALAICKALANGSPDNVIEFPTAPKAPARLSMAQIYDLADKAGKQAASECTPTPMAVTTEGGRLIEWVNGGVCGFAWVKIRPAMGEFVSYCKRKNIGRTNEYAGGFDIWVHQYSQSMELKAAYAAGFANELQKHGINASSHSRID